MLSLILLVASLASAHGYWCGVCSIADSNYCCYGEGDHTYCCTQEEYFKGGFMDTQTKIIVGAVVALIAVVVFIAVCCWCCPCCPCHRRRHQGVVYNSVQPASAQATRSPIFQSAAVGMDPKLHPVQYPVQHPSNPYIESNASAPPFVPNHN